MKVAGETLFHCVQARIYAGISMTAIDPPCSFDNVPKGMVRRQRLSHQLLTG